MINPKWWLLARPGAWGDAVRDVAWQLSPGTPEDVPLSWPLEPEVAESIRVRWPARYGWENAGRMVDPILNGLGSLVRVDRADIEQPVGNIVLFEFELEGRSFTAGIDYEDRGDDLHEAIDKLPLAFKMHHLAEGYGRDNVVPGGYISTKHRMYRQFPRFREYRARAPQQFDVHGRFSPDLGPEPRRRAVRVLQEQNSFGFEGGLGHAQLWGAFMREACRSKLCLEVEGRGPFSSRPVDFFAAGVCMVAPKPRSVLHVPMIHEEHAIFARHDCSDLVELCERYLADDAARDRISANGRDFFDRYLRPEQLAAYYLHECIRVARA